MKKSKLLYCISAAALSAVILAGCGKSASSGSSASGAASSAATSAASAASSAEASAASSSAADSAATSEDASAAASSEEASDVASSVAYTEVTDSGSTQIDPSTIENKEDSGTAQTADATPVDKDPNQQITNPDGKRLQIVVFGDSQFDNVRDNTSIGYLLHWYLQADVYNCAMGGTSASTVPDEERDMSDDNWSSRSFIGMAKCAVGEVNPDFFSDYHAYDVFKSCDLSKTDVFIVEYGANDYFMKAALSDIDRQDTYVGALYMGMKKLMKAYPNAQIVFCAPTYAQFFGPNHSYIGDSNMTSNGIGTLYDYCCAGMNIAQTLGVNTLDCYDQLNMSGANADDYLMDGIHLSEKCRKL